jgi:predicted ArsR family transcriptional regulator
MVERVAAHLDDAAIEARLQAIAERLDAEGYLADCEPTDDGRFHLRLHNCPIWPVADRFPQACAAEHGVMEDLLPNAVVSRTCHKAASIHTCTYEIDPGG